MRRLKFALTALCIAATGIWFYQVEASTRPETMKINGVEQNYNHSLIRTIDLRKQHTPNFANNEEPDYLIEATVLEIPTVYELYEREDYVLIKIIVNGKHHYAELEDKQKLKKILRKMIAK